MKLFIILVLLGIVFAGESRYRRGPRRYPGRRHKYLPKRRHRRYGNRCEYKDKTKCKRWLKKYKCKKCYKYKKFWNREKVWYKVPKYYKKCKHVGKRNRKCRDRFVVCKPKTICKQTKGWYDRLIETKCKRRKDRKVCWRGKPHFVCKKKRVWRIVDEKKVCGKKQHGLKKPSGSDMYKPKHYGYYGHGKKCWFKPIRKKVVIKKCRKIMGEKMCKKIPGRMKCRKVVKKIWHEGYKKCRTYKDCKKGYMKHNCLSEGYEKCRFFKKYIKKYRWVKVRPYWKKVATGKTSCKFMGNFGEGWTTRHGKCYHKKYPKKYFGAKKK